MGFSAGSPAGTFEIATVTATLTDGPWQRFCANPEVGVLRRFVVVVFATVIE